MLQSSKIEPVSIAVEWSRFVSFGLVVSRCGRSNFGVSRRGRGRCSDRVISDFRVFRVAVPQFAYSVD